jgi:putative ABC transport system substrate-binding protein
MRRREFIEILGSAVAWPLAARAQQLERMRRIGVLMGNNENDPVGQFRLGVFRDALQELGWSEGRNVRFEIRWSGGDPDRVRALAGELVKLAPDVILSYGTAALAALKPATSAIPIVFVVVNDPVTQGFIPSVGRPGGNITGFSFMDYSMIGKALGLLKEIAPNVIRVGFLFNPDDYPYYEVYLRSSGGLQQALSVEVAPLRVHSDVEIESVIRTLAAEAGGGLIAPPSTFNNVHRHTLIEQTNKYRLPAVFHLREDVAEGGLISYGPDQTDIFRRAAPYLDRILKGANPGDLPVQAPTKFEFFINLRTARTLGLTIPPGVLAIADEVIE